MSSVLSSTPISSEDTNNESRHQNEHHMITRFEVRIFKPCLFNASTDLSIPVSVKQALQIPHWYKAMQDEYNALIENNTWSLTELSKGPTPVGCKWIFKIKYNVDGTFQRHKARLVAKGFHQQHGFDYSETFSLVVKPSTIRIVLTVVVSNNWSVHQIDINNAFLYGDLKETMFMPQPPGLESANHSLVCKLNKVIYGLKQAPRSWFHKLSATLSSLGFSSTKSDSSLFVKFHKTHTMMVLIYVDDIIITGTSTSNIQALISCLRQHFALKDMYRLHYFLGIEAS